MGRTMPLKCEHGKVLDWGDFGPDQDGSVGIERCVECDALGICQGELVRSAAHNRLHRKSHWCIEWREITAPPDTQEATESSKSARRSGDS
jgi:hypothetical protein